MRCQKSARGSFAVGGLTLALLLGAVATPVVGVRVREARESRPAPAVAAAGMSVPNPSRRKGVQRTHAASTYRKSPLSFEANQGQANPSVKFLARGAGYQLYLTSTQAVLSLNREGSGGEKKQPEKDFRARANARPSPTGDVVRMRILGARSDTFVSGEEVLPGKVNYLLGSDPRAWRTNVATYGKVRYKNVYQGIDLVYYGSQRRLEYDFHLAPGADPGAIRSASRASSVRS